MKSEEIIFGIFFTSLIILVLITGITFVFYLARRQRLRQQLQAYETKLTYEKELRLVETEVREKLLQQVGSELHDNIAQYCTAMNIQLENIKLDHPNMAEALAPISLYLDEATDQLRALGRTLNADYIGKAGLLEALDIEIPRIRALRRFKVDYRNNCKSLALNKETQLLLFRSFQEIVQNALRHANAEHMSIEAKGDAAYFELRIQDNGKGFDVENINRSNKASGLSNIIKRMQLAELECSIDSKIGGGTVYIIHTKIN